MKLKLFLTLSAFTVFEMSADAMKVRDETQENQEFSHIKIQQNQENQLNIGTNTVSDVSSTKRIENHFNKIQVNGLYNGKNKDEYLEWFNSELSKFTNKSLTENTEDKKENIEVISIINEEVKQENIKIIPVINEVKEEIIEIIPVINEVKEEIIEVIPAINEVKEEIIEVIPVINEVKEEIIEIIPVINEEVKQENKEIVNNEVVKNELTPTVTSWKDITAEVLNAAYFDSTGKYLKKGFIIENIHEGFNIYGSKYVFDFSGFTIPELATSFAKGRDLNNVKEEDLPYDIFLRILFQHDILGQDTRDPRSSPQLHLAGKAISKHLKMELTRSGDNVKNEDLKTIKGIFETLGYKPKTKTFSKLYHDDRGKEAVYTKNRLTFNK